MPKSGMKSRRPRRSTRQRVRSNPSTGATTTKHEVAIQIVDFFDYETGTTGSVKNYWWDNAQNLFNNNVLGTSGQEDTFCRVRSLEVYVLPRRGIDVATGSEAFNNAAAMYTVNVQTPGITNATIGVTALPEAKATNTQVTNILPQFDTKWKRVFGCNLQKTFQSAVIRPFFDRSRQCLFSMQCLDPTSGLPIDGEGSETVKIRVKVVLHIDQPIAPVQQAKFAVLSNNDTSTPQIDLSGVALPEIRPSYCQMDVKRIRDNMA
jgi:hypothetical protein